MKKIRLNLDAIAVESFPTAAVSDEQGTVEGNMASRVGDTWCVTCGEATCFGEDTCSVEYC